MVSLAVNFVAHPNLGTEARGDSPRAFGMTENDRLARLHKLLLSLSSISAAASDSEGLLELIVGEARLFADASGAVVERVDGDDLVYVKAAGQIAGHVGLRVAQAESLSGMSVRERSIKRCDDTETDSRVDRAACRRIGIRSMLVVPLIYGEDVVGVVKVSSDRAAAFSDEHVQALQLAAGIIAAVVGRQFRLENSERDGEVLSLELEASQAEGESYRRAAMCDALTGLPNRRSFDEALDVAVFHGADAPGTMALLFVDLNAFKTVNDNFGHVVGDMALRRVGEVLRANAAEGDLVARLAGDEFVVLMRNLVVQEREVSEFCQRVLGVLENVQTLADGQRMKLSIAVGVALHDDPALTRAEWLRRADDAMYRAKQSGRFRFYGHTDPELRIVGSNKPES